MPKSKGRRQREKTKKRRIDEHRRTGPLLEPPLVHMMGDKLTYHSWMNDRLPEMLWASLILVSMERYEAFEEFVRIIEFVENHERKAELKDLTISGIAGLENELRREAITFITSNPRTALALASLRNFESLPSRETWEECLRDFTPDTRLLANAVADTLNYASISSTDCCWLTARAKLAAGQIKINGRLTGLINALETYPGMEPDTQEGARIRTFGNGFAGPSAEKSEWTDAFWKEAWEKTPCISREQAEWTMDARTSTSRQGIIKLNDALAEHWRTTHSTTAVDRKHDGTFGIAFYTLRILSEIISIGMSNGVLSRLGLRTILETRINLKYLIDQGDVELWKKWRGYGAGQAKLASLKFEESGDAPEFIDLDDLEGIAYEDLREELLTVDLGNWAGTNLRAVSEKVNLKETYDQFYTWTSAYSHGAWGAIRETSFQTCGNPLHRLHRYPERQPLQDCLYDAVMLVDEILTHVDDEYPSFPHRLLQGT